MVEAGDKVLSRRRKLITFKVTFAFIIAFVIRFVIRGLYTLFI